MSKQHLSPNSSRPVPTQQAFMLAVNRDTCYLQLHISTKKALAIIVMMALMIASQVDSTFIETALLLIDILW